MQTVGKIGIATTLYLVAFIADYIVTLFQTTKGATITNFMGLKASSQATKEISFALTWRSLIIYLCFVIIWLLAAFIINKIIHQSAAVEPKKLS
ncbi:MAG: hypothetical protein ABF899_05520 [Oenococcus sp.]|uniref:hypothetical protein n=1 Tax=Oenococcus sp. TaxID=1979414 RepID=UPI0039E9EB9D